MFKFVHFTKLLQHIVVEKTENGAHILFTYGVQFTCFFPLSPHHIHAFPSSIIFERKCCMEYIRNVWKQGFNKRSKGWSTSRDDNNVDIVGE